MTSDAGDDGVIALPADTGVAASPVIRLHPMDSASAAVLAQRVAAIDPWARLAFTSDHLARYLAAVEPGAPRYLVSLADGTIAGGLVLRLNWLRGAYIQFLVVLPEHAHAGLGTRLLAWIDSEARRRNDQNLWVAASDFNDAAIRLYERNGFARAALFDGLIAADGAEVLLRKRLRQP